MEELIIKPQKYTARVSSKEQFSEKVFLVKISLNEPPAISFIPGQFVNIFVADKVSRQYSIASCPSNQTQIELIVDVFPGGPGSIFFQNLQVGDSLSFVGPLGKFTLVQDAGPVVFLASGTGIAPFKSMTDSLVEINAQVPLYLYFGFRYARDVFWNDYFSNLEKQNQQFHYLLTLSKPETGWAGKSGYVQDHIEPSLLTDKTTRFYVCGGQRFVTGAVAFLREKLTSEDHIHFEPF